MLNRLADIHPTHKTHMLLSVTRSLISTTAHSCAIFVGSIFPLSLRASFFSLLAGITPTELEFHCKSILCSLTVFPSLAGGDNEHDTSNLVAVYGHAHVTVCMQLYTSTSSN